MRRITAIVLSLLVLGGCSIFGGTHEGRKLVAVKALQMIDPTCHKDRFKAIYRHSETGVSIFQVTCRPKIYIVRCWNASSCESDSRCAVLAVITSKTEK